MLGTGHVCLFYPLFVLTMKIPEIYLYFFVIAVAEFFNYLEMKHLQVFTN